MTTLYNLPIAPGILTKEHYFDEKIRIDICIIVIRVKIGELEKRKKLSRKKKSYVQ